MRLELVGRTEFEAESNALVFKKEPRRPWFARLFKHSVYRDILVKLSWDNTSNSLRGIIPEILVGEKVRLILEFDDKDLAIASIKQ